ncbi:hypothetical protein LLG95_13805 [bacterium]|nr:hypothetical protein [bacterium]
MDCNSYPAQASSFPGSGAYGINDLANCPVALAASCRWQPTWVHKRDQNDGVYTLTTPIAYMSSFASDPFASSKGATFAYSVGGSYGQGWIMWSYGPDMDEQATTGNTTGGDVRVSQGMYRSQPGCDTYYYNPGTQTPSQQLIEATYDPTNGTNSNGDVYKLKQ